MNNDIIIRQASEADFDALVEFRLAMFREMGWTDEPRLVELAPRYLSYLREHFTAGDFRAWVAERGGAILGGVGLLWQGVPPTVRNLSGRQAYVLGLYVRPEERRRGVARLLVDATIASAREGDAAVIALHTSEHGRALYERLGFVDSPEMRLFTDPTSAAWSREPHPLPDSED